MPKVPVKGCPKGYTNINGDCVPDITPPLPRGSAPEQEIEDSDKPKEDES